MLVSEWDVNIQFDCANVCMIEHEDMFFRHGDMKTIFRQEDMKTIFRQEDMKTCFLDKNLSFIGKKL